MLLTVDKLIQALIRDGYRCAVTGKYDDAVFGTRTVTLQQVLAAGGTILTRCAHILPEFTFFSINTKGPGDEETVRLLNFT